MTPCSRGSCPVWTLVEGLGGPWAATSRTSIHIGQPIAVRVLESGGFLGCQESNGLDYPHNDEKARTLQAMGWPGCMPLIFGLRRV